MTTFKGKVKILGSINPRKVKEEKINEEIKRALDLKAQWLSTRSEIY